MNRVTVAWDTLEVQVFFFTEHPVTKTNKRNTIADFILFFKWINVEIMNKLISDAIPAPINKYLWLDFIKTQKKAFYCALTHKNTLI